jgi:hypothetical protein
MSTLKIECARRQLGTALDLYLPDLDPVSVHCLVNGGCELIEFYARKAGGVPFTSHILKDRPDLNIAALRKIQPRSAEGVMKTTTNQAQRRPRVQ